MGESNKNNPAGGSPLFLALKELLTLLGKFTTDILNFAAEHIHVFCCYADRRIRSGHERHQTLLPFTFWGTCILLIGCVGAVALLIVLLSYGDKGTARLAGLAFFPWTAALFGLAYADIRAKQKIQHDMYRDGLKFGRDIESKAIQQTMAVEHRFRTEMMVVVRDIIFSPKLKYDLTKKDVKKHARKALESHSLPLREDLRAPLATIKAFYYDAEMLGNSLYRCIEALSSDLPFLLTSHLVEHEYTSENDQINLFMSLTKLNDQFREILATVLRRKSLDDINSESSGFRRSLKEMLYRACVTWNNIYDKLDKMPLVPNDGIEKLATKFPAFQAVIEETLDTTNPFRLKHVQFKDFNPMPYDPESNLIRDLKSYASDKQQD